MNNPRIEKPKQMRPGAMAGLQLQHEKNNRLNECTPNERPAILTDHELENRQNQKTGGSINQAGFRQKAGIGEVDFTTARNLDKNMSKRLATPGFLSRNENLIIAGAWAKGVRPKRWGTRPAWIKRYCANTRCTACAELVATAYKYFNHLILIL